MVEMVVNALVVLLLLVILLSMAGWVYLDAPEYGMNPTKSALVSFFVPFFGFFTYLFEREEHIPEPDREEHFVDGPFEIHKSRADDAPWATDGDEVSDGETKDGEQS